jgi:hypothetical protein
MKFKLNTLTRAGEKVAKEMRIVALKAMLSLPMSYYDDSKHSTGQICTRLATDAPTVRVVRCQHITNIIHVHTFT